MSNKKRPDAMDIGELLDEWRRLVNLPRTPGAVEQIVALGGEIALRLYRDNLIDGPDTAPSLEKQLREHGK